MTWSAEPGYQPRLPRVAIVKAPGLLPMWYSPAELGTDSGVPVRTLREWLQHDLPHRRDDTGHIWIDGIVFASWIRTKRLDARRPLESNEAYCLRCRKPVILESTSQTQRGKQLLLQGTCPECGSGINRGASHG
jgi:hypothetical protein